MAYPGVGPKAESFYRIIGYFFRMAKNYLPWLLTIAFYAVLILGVNFVLAFAYGVVTGAELFSAPSYARTLSDLAFLEGALLLTLGAFLEFFARALSASMAKGLMLPYEVLSRRLAPGEGATGEEHSGGWALIFIGALLIVLSAIFAIIIAK